MMYVIWAALTFASIQVRRKERNLKSNTVTMMCEVNIKVNIKIKTQMSCCVQYVFCRHKLSWQQLWLWHSSAVLKSSALLLLTRKPLVSKQWQRHNGLSLSITHKMRSLKHSIHPVCVKRWCFLVNVNIICLYHVISHRSVVEGKKTNEWDQDARIRKELIICSCFVITVLIFFPANFTGGYTDSNNSFFSPPVPCCLPADAGHALCLCGVVQEESWSSVWAAGHNQQLCIKDASASQTKHSENQKERHRTCPQ